MIVLCVIFNSLMATVSGLEVDFETNLIDPLYMNAAIYEMNKKTEEGFYELSICIRLSSSSANY